MAPAAAIAGPDTKADPWGHVETFEWSSSSQGARLGVMVMSLTPELRGYFGAANDRGVLVAKVEPDSAAAKAGIKVGDVIVDVKGNAIDEPSDVIDALSKAKAGDKVGVAVVRDHKQMSLDAKIGTSSSAKAEADWMKRFFPWFRPDRDGPARG
ncbi:MAG TPA: PDZ domain-containing protein [Kofleriaceae bacterium]|nr:PDZ domain-containing protein [Kofleriaceae bacterium]